MKIFYTTFNTYNVISYNYSFRISKISALLKVGVKQVDKSHFSTVMRCDLVIFSDERLTFERSTLLSLQGGNLNLINLSDTKF